MDIIVRIPERQLRHFCDDKMTSNFAFWRLSNRPKKLAVGDHVFFTRPEGVMFAAPVRSIMEGDDLMEELNPFHMFGDAGNFNVCWNGTEDTVRFNVPISSINYKGRGFRYATPDEQAELHNWLHWEAFNKLS